MGRRIAIGSGIVVAVATAGLWSARQRITIHLLDQHLARARVSADYRITRLDPFSQTIENVRIGDPARPDLVARRLTLGWRYGFSGPVLASVDADGVRMSASWRDGRLTLGAIDRLLPRTSTAGPALPDLRVTIADGRLALSTPAGRVDASLDGSGNPAREFTGRITAGAPALTIGGCAIDQAAARLTLRIANGAPHLAGPITIASGTCAGKTLSIGAGTALAAIDLGRDFDRVSGRVTLAGFAGRGGTASFGAIGGTISGATNFGGGGDARGRAALTVADMRLPAARIATAALRGGYRLRPGNADFEGAVTLSGLTAQPAIRTNVFDTAHAAASTPIAPIAARIGTMLDRWLARSDMTAQIAVTASRDRQSLRLDQAVLRAATGDRLALNGSAANQAGSIRIAGMVAGAALPALTLDLRRAGPAAPVAATVRVAPYAVDGARLALAPIRITAGAHRLSFATIATIDGPLPSGRIEGLVAPVVGSVGAAAGLRVGEGCTPIGFHRIVLASFTLDPGGITLCGRPLVARPPGGATTIAAQADDVALHGRSGTTPLVLRARRLRLSGSGAFAGEAVAVELGGGDDPTRLAVATLQGGAAPSGFAGTFVDAAGSIRNVPLMLSNAAGAWRLDRGALRLKGAIGVSDRAAAVRFHPLMSDDVTLSLIDGKIHAAAALRAPRQPQIVADIGIDHDLATGVGRARIAVPELRFTTRGLQPEMLTPLTLGVVANVVGTVSGDGWIAWTPAALTSGGTFRTDRIDLAAAFGPVTGLAGTIHFSDLLGLVTAPHQEARIVEINPGVAVADGVAHYQLLGGERVRIEDARWPFAGGTLALDPTTLDFTRSAERRLTFRIARLDAGAFIQQLDFPNIAATGTIDGRLPMIFDDSGGRIEGGSLQSQGSGTLAYIGELSNAQLGTMGKLAFDALKAIRYSRLDISLDGQLDGEIFSGIRFEGVHQATGERTLMARMIRNLPFRFNVQIRAPFRGLVGSARSYINPALLLQGDLMARAKAEGATRAEPGGAPAVQPGDSGSMR